MVAVSDGDGEGIDLLGCARPVGCRRVAGFLGRGVGERTGCRVDGDGAPGGSPAAQRVRQRTVGGVGDGDRTRCDTGCGVGNTCGVAISGRTGHHRLNVDDHCGAAGPEDAQQAEQPAEVLRRTRGVVDDDAEAVDTTECGGLGIGRVGEVAVRVDGDDAVLRLTFDGVDRHIVVIVDSVEGAGDGAVDSLPEDDGFRGGALVVEGVLELAHQVPQRHDGRGNGIGGQ